MVKSHQELVLQYHHFCQTQMGKTIRKNENVSHITLQRFETHQYMYVLHSYIATKCKVNFDHCRVYMQKNQESYSTLGIMGHEVLEFSGQNYHPKPA